MSKSSTSSTSSNKKIIIKKKEHIEEYNETKQYRKATDYERKKEFRDHALYAPETYIGNIEQKDRDEIVYDSETDTIIHKTISISRGFEKLFNEVYTNASDNVGESRRVRVDPGCIRVEMDRKVLSIYNEGIPIPVEMDPKENMYTPYMIFGTPWSSSNYKEERNEAGRNGYGAKLVNLFSKWFTIEVGDDYNKLKYYQKWYDNMGRFDEPVIEKYNGKPFVKVTYELDFERFGYTEYPDEAFGLFERHCIDISLNASIPVYFNDKKIFFEDIRDYARMIYGEKALDNSFIHYEWPPGTETITKKNGVVVAKDKFVVPTARMCVMDTPYESYNISFVNGMMTREGGDHLTVALKTATSLVVKKANEKSEPKQKKGEKETQKKGGRALINLTDVKQHISIVLCFRVVNPGWESQTKTLYTHPKKLPPIVFNIDEKKLEETLKWEIMDILLNTVDRKQEKKLNKTNGRKAKNIGPFKGRDANFAGTNKSHTCTLLVIEGTSASNYVECMISELKSRDTMGYFELKGKMLNVMKASKLKILENEEISELKKVIGLNDGVDYSNEKEFMKLRYGEVVFVTDQDVDGEHIKALGINYFYCRFPELLDRGFFSWFATPIVRVQKGTGKKAERAIFYSLNDFEEWKKDMKGKWEIKYCKGLGTSTREEVKYDVNNDPIYVKALYDEEAPGYIELAFHPKLAGDRKDWIKSYRKENDDIIRPEIEISSFINYDLVKFSIYNVKRSIPSWDGLKPSQRKILWASYLKWNWTSSDKSFKKIKVSEFGGFVSERTDYHHGEMSLYGAIIAMAQDFVGSNNLPYFFPDGQFGSRNKGGKDHASPRYLFTKPMWWLPYVYRDEDFPILEHEYDDQNKKIEPKIFLPIIPMSLVNGAEGIGTGWSTFIPSCSPMDIVEWYINRINNIENQTMVPWYRGFEGDLYIIDKSKAKKEDEKAIIEAKALREEQDDTDEEETEESGKKDEKDKDGEEKDSEDKDGDVEMEKKLGKARDRIILKREEKKKKLPAYRMITTGVFEVYDKYTLVKELPLGVWNKKYDEWLESLAIEKEEYKEISNIEEEKVEINGKKPKPIMVKKLESFDVIDVKDDKQWFKLYGFRGPSESSLHLKRGFGLTNMYLLTTDDKPIKFNTLDDILEDFYQRRRPYYSIRKDNMLMNYANQIRKMDEKVAFILAVIEKRLKIRNVSKESIYTRMDELGLNKEIYKEVKLSAINKDSVEKLLKQKEDLLEKEGDLKRTDPDQLWLDDLYTFRDEYNKHYNDYEEFKEE